ncbi:61_t:CDS:2, partial [Ambispora gerdemannii]
TKVRTFEYEEIFEYDDEINAEPQTLEENTKKAQDCPTCLEKINRELAKCEGGFNNEVESQKNKCSKCQKEYISSKTNNLGDKTGNLACSCSKKPNKQPSKEGDNNDDNSDDNKNKIPKVSTVRKYCKDNDVQRLEYDEDTSKLIITYKGNRPKSELETLTEEQEEIKNYLKKLGKQDKNKNKRRFLTDSDWEENNHEHQRHQSQQTN